MESAYLTLAMAQRHGQTLGQIVFIGIATNVKYALSNNAITWDLRRRLCATNIASWQSRAELFGCAHVVWTVFATRNPAIRYDN